MRTIEDEVNHLRAEFLEMPGLRLKHQQVQRLCGIEHQICQTVLDVLVSEGFLCTKPGGHYARCTDCAGVARQFDRYHPHPAKADLSLGPRSQQAS